MMITIFFRKFGVLLILTCLAACSSVTPAPERSLSFDTRIYIGAVPLDVVVFNTKAARELGLMHVQSLPKGTGGLFVYPQETDVAFWMKNTRFSMDMLFFDHNKSLIHIVRSITPCRSTPCYSVKVANVKYIVEIMSSSSDENKFRRGDRLLIAE